MAPLKIGVLGGIGPEATGEFYLKLIRKLQQENLITKNEDFPQIFINSIPAPELIFNDLPEADIKPYLYGLQELDSLQPDFIVMVCNTIHLFHEELQSKIKSPLIDLRKEVEKEIKKQNCSTITIIGTPSTITLGLYQLEGIQYLNPNQKEMDILSEAIFNFNKGLHPEEQQKKAEHIAEKYISLGSQMIVLGCTELAVMLEEIKIPKFNTIAILVDSVVRKYKEKRGML